MKKQKLLFVVEAMGGGVFTYIVDLANELVHFYDMYIAYAVRPQTPSDYREQFDRRIHCEANITGYNTSSFLQSRYIGQMGFLRPAYSIILYATRVQFFNG